jgi:uncharacterized protein YdeI (YjbR/CyaY-like superfamily)
MATRKRDGSKGTSSDEKPARYFARPADWRRWLEAHHADTAELWVGFHKTSSDKPSITWPQSVDEALCFGWIDGRRQSIDEHRYKIRFTPRKASSKWSLINVRRVGELRQLGRMRPAGEKAFAARKEKATGTYSYEQRNAGALPPAFEKRLKGAAKKFFASQAPWYQRTAIHWVISARQEATRERRMEILIRCCASETTIPPLTRPTGKKK